MKALTEVQTNLGTMGAAVAPLLAVGSFTEELVEVQTGGAETAMADSSSQQPPGATSSSDSASASAEVEAAAEGPCMEAQTEVQTNLGTIAAAPSSPTSSEGDLSQDTRTNDEGCLGDVGQKKQRLELNKKNE